MSTPAAVASEIVLLSGHDLRSLLSPRVAIDALRETYAALADNRADQGRSVGFEIEGGSIHVKSGLLPGSHRAFASKVNVNLPTTGNLASCPPFKVWSSSRMRRMAVRSQLWSPSPLLALELPPRQRWRLNLVRERIPRGRRSLVAEPRRSISSTPLRLYFLLSACTSMTSMRHA